MESLFKIQQELKAPKGQFNSFGKYRYRSCEDILEAVKPLLKKHGLTLILKDDIKEVANIPFVESTATLKTKTGELVAESKASAGIDPNKKGMDLSQCFGTSSTYSRKYALNGLFLIDDTKDADTEEHATDSKPTLNEDRFNNALKLIETGKATKSSFEQYKLTPKQQQIVDKI